MGRPAILKINIIADSSQATSAMNAAGSAFSGLGNMGKSAFNAISTGVAVVTGAAAALTVSVVKTGIAYNTLQQKANASFTTILGSGEAATKMMDELTAFSKTSPFPKQAFIAATQQMLAFGISADKTIPILKAVQDATAASGGSSQDLQDIVFIMSQISAAGKITGQDLMQFGQRGINAADLIGGQMGKTGAQIKAEITKGTIGANEALDALTAGMAAKFGGAAAGVKLTWSGTVDRIKGGMRDIGSALVEPFISAKGGGLAVEWGNKVADLIRSLIPLATQVAGAIGKWAAGMGDKLAPMLDGIIKALGSMDLSSLASSFGGIAKTIAPLLALFGAKGLGSIAGMLGPLGGLIPKLNPVVAAIVAIVATTPELRDAFLQVLDAVKPLMPIITQLAGIIGKALAGAVKSLMPTFMTLVRIVAQLVEGLGPILGKVLTALSPLFDVLGQALDAILVALTPLIPPILKVADSLVSALLPIVVALAPLIMEVANVFVILVNAILPLMPLVVGLIDIVAKLAVFLFQNMAAALTVVVENFGKVVQAIGDAIAWVAKIVSAFIDANNGIGGAMKAIWAAITGAFSKAFDFVSDLVTSGINKLISTFRGVVSAVSSALAGVGDAIAAPFIAGFNAVKGAIESVVKWITDKVNALKSAVSGGIDLVKSTYNKMARTWNAIEIKLPEIKVPLGPTLGGQTIGLPDLPLLANGAYVTRATAAIIGERGSEIVAPEAMLRAIMREEAGGNVKLVFNVPPTANPTETGREVAKVLRSYFAAGGRLTVPA